MPNDYCLKYVFNVPTLFCWLVSIGNYVSPEIILFFFLENIKIILGNTLLLCADFFFLFKIHLLEKPAMSLGKATENDGPGTWALATHGGTLKKLLASGSILAVIAI